MKSERVFCESCRKNVEYTITNLNLENELKGKIYHYNGNKTSCNECNEEVFVSEIFDENLKALYDKYREENEIISLNEVRSITEKYDIGKRPLSLLLKWGEQTFSRYYDGDMPTPQYSNELKHIYADLDYFEKLLEENRDQITPTAYMKSKKAINLHRPEKKKIDFVIDYLCSICELTPLALQKALYYVQGFYSAFYDKPLFSDDCEAWAHGPVYRDVYFKYKGYSFNPIEVAKKADTSMFSAMEKEILDSVIRNVCCYNGKILEQFTHNEEPWLITRGDLSNEHPSDEIIDKKLIKKYFTEVKRKHNMVSPMDIKKYTADMFEQI